ncbi:helix-turn-helix domain-containing protein [Hymenobacter cellulosilyticus]|uniref:helix-turn-helix domain-containing protein n=1 Tax=Hymenobacter cellulosilyticus TaxID=2932248 RepID=UPI0035CBC3AD
MVERIRALLQARQLSPTQFADAIGVARPIVSHILSGRNKPSLEVVQKIIGAFPELSLPWLLSGTGPMLASSVPLAPVSAVAPASEAAPGVEAVETL